MEPKFFNFVWRYSKRDQIVILLLSCISFPLLYLSLEIPKIIINEAISGTDFPLDLQGFEVEQIPYLTLLCLLFLLTVVANNGVKWLMNVQIGMTGERMLRRLRYMLFQRVMRFRIAKFRSTKPGEVIQSILGEIEPLGGFIGEVIATPIYQGGQLVVYMTFIFVQDWVLGLAAVALYPFQAWLIPKLQAKIVRLNKERAANTRKLADTIGESVTIISDVHTNDTARWHMGQVAGRLYENTVIRLALFRRKFTIKFINNFINQLIPFFFYGVGGWLVIKGDLDFGSLVAVLAAYKDVASPWKAILNYVQRWTDFNSRYVFVIENFSGDDVLPESRVNPEGADAEPLTGALTFSDVEGGPGTGGLTVGRMEVKPGEAVAVLGGLNGGREALLRMAAGLAEPTSGRVTMGGRILIECTLPQVGAAVAYVGAEPGIVARSMRDNLLYGLYRGSPDLEGEADPRLVDMLKEARMTGNSTAHPEGDWSSYQAAGLEGPEALDARLLELVDLVGLSGELYSNALSSRLDEKRAAEWTDRIMSARAHLSDNGADLSDVIEAWEPDTFNTNATILENVLYALPLTGRDDAADYIEDPAVATVLEQAGAMDLLYEIGWEIASEFSELIDAVEESSSVLDSFAGYAKADILAAHELIVASTGPKAKPPKPADKTRIVRLALAFILVRDRLDVLEGDRIERLMACRRKARELIAARDDFASFDEDRFSPARQVAGNILHGKRRFDRRSAWKSIEAMLASAIDAAGLRDDLIRLGLTRPLGSGSGLSTASRRRIGLVRGLIKRPHLMVLDGIAASDSIEDVALRSAIRKTVPDAMILYAASEEEAVEIADQVATIDKGGVTRCEKRDNSATIRPEA